MAAPPCTVSCWQISFISFHCLTRPFEVWRASMLRTSRHLFVCGTIVCGTTSVTMVRKVSRGPSFLSHSTPRGPLMFQAGGALLLCLLAAASSLLHLHLYQPEKPVPPPTSAAPAFVLLGISPPLGVLIMRGVSTSSGHGGLPPITTRGQSRLLDVALSLDFAINRTLFWRFSEQCEGGSAMSVTRGS
jgi:hypothetical protein